MTERRVQHKAGVRLIEGIPVWGDPVDAGALSQIQTCAKTAAHVALMADHHKGYAVPIGGVVAYYNAISPSGVGFDIACGNKAVRTDMPASEARSAIGPLMDSIFKAISFGVGRQNEERVDHELFDDEAWQIPAVAALRDRAASQLGTVGGGNHYVDLFADEDGWTWIGVHFGSRGFGHGIAKHYLAAGGAKDGMDVEPLVLATDSNLGGEYLEGMRLAGLYAYAGRDWVCAKVAQLLGAKIVEQVHNHHNFAWLEVHDGEDMWVVRKGATPAFPGQRGFIGGSMGENAVIIEGSEEPVGKIASTDREVGVRDGGRGESLPPVLPDENEASQGTPTSEQKLSLFSTIHGAGRVMSRMAAKGKHGQRGAISREDMAAWLAKAGVELRGGDLDEAPQAYKRLPEVLAHHSATIKVLHTLTPIGVAMAGPWERDPYRD